VVFATDPPEVRRLRGIELFAGCNTRELRRISELSTVANVGAGRVLCHRGDPGRECYILLSGQAQVEVNGRCYTAMPGELLGEVALFTPTGRRTATATAVTDLTVLAFTRAGFTALMRQHSNVAHKVLRATTRRLIEDVETP
jgi:CRP-like cAMP-binding protein